MCPEKSALKPSAEQIAELRKQADSLYGNQDYAAALPLYQQLADAGNPAAMTLVGLMYGRGFAEEVGRRLVEAYERPPENPAEVLARYANGEENLDPLREFTEACREERAKALQQV